MKILALAKQVPKLEAYEMGGDGRIVRENIPSEMSAYCRRAVSKGVELARELDGHCSVVTLGPPMAIDILKECLAWGADDAFLISDPAFAGSDTLATARILSAFIALKGPFDLILVGKSSLDAETGQVGPQLAELLELPFAAAVRQLIVHDDNAAATVRCEQDDGWREAIIQLPSVLAVAERLCVPAKVSAEKWSEISDDVINRVSEEDLGGPGPWGINGSPTIVGASKVLEYRRTPILFDGSIEDQMGAVLSCLSEKGFLGTYSKEENLARPLPHLNDSRREGPVFAVLFEPGRPRFVRELIGSATELAQVANGWIVGISQDQIDAKEAWSWGVDELLGVSGHGSEEDVAQAISVWAESRSPLVIIAPSTFWGREIASRVAARSGSGLIGDALELELDSGKLIAWKSAFGDSRHVAISSSSPLQMATLRPGIHGTPRRREGNGEALVSNLQAHNSGRVKVISTFRDDDWEALSRAETVIGVGAGVEFEQYGLIHELADLVGAELAATRKVTDLGWLPRSRQVGITGTSISPKFYFAVGMSGKLNHMVGVRSADVVVAINTNRDALVFANCDLGIIGDWRRVLPVLINGIRSRINQVELLLQRERI